MKKYIFLGLLVLIIGVGAYFALNMESIVKRIVHKYGSEVTGTDVNMQGFNLSIKDGTGTIDKVTVGNPSGYSTDNIFELEQIAVKVNLKSLTTDTIIIDSINVQNPKITYEMASLTKNNFLDIQKNISNYSSKSASKPAEEKKTSEGPGKKVIIKSLTVNGGELDAVSKLIPNAQSANAQVKLPPITMNNIGEGSNGATVADTIMLIVAKIMDTASQTVMNNNLGDLKNIANDNINMAKDTVNQAKTDAENAVKNIGGLFGK